MADELISRQAVLSRISTIIKRITPIEENRDMFFHDSGINGAITGALLEVKKIPAVDAVEVGSCDGCIYSNRKRPQKCSCCRRNRDMKDCYERREENAADKTP